MKTYTITFPENLLQALGSLLDAGVRHEGLKSAHAASAILQLIEAAEPDPEQKEQDNGDTDD